MPSLAPSAAIGERALALHPRVALRPEPFGALAYHYDTRRLVFLKHPDLVRVVDALGDHVSVDATLDFLEISERHRGPFHGAIASLLEAEMLHDRPR